MDRVVTAVTGVVVELLKDRAGVVEDDLGFDDVVLGIEDLYLGQQDIRRFEALTRTWRSKR